MSAQREAVFAHYLNATWRSGKAAAALDAGRRPLSLHWLADLAPNLSRVWRVSHLLPHTGLAVVYGESNSGKTYLVLDLVLHVALGRDWCGRRTRPGVVVYIAAENPASVENRAALWRREKLNGDGPDVPFAVLPQALNLRDPGADLPELLDLLAEVAREHGPIAVVAIDTLARVIAGGNENASEDMGAVIAACDRIREALDCLVLVIHHSGKDTAKGARGHSSLRAAADTEIEVTATAVGHLATVRKQRDGATGDAFTFRLRPVPLGVTPDGEEVAPCLVDGLAEREGKASGAAARLTDREALAFDALVELLQSTRRPAPAEVLAANGGRLRQGQYVASVEDWRARAYDRVLSEAGDESRKKAFQRLREALQRKRRICTWQQWVWEAVE